MLSQKRFLWYYQLLFPLRVSCSCQKLCNWNNLCDWRKMSCVLTVRKDDTNILVALSFLPPGGNGGGTLWTTGPHSCDSNRLGSIENSSMKATCGIAVYQKLLLPKQDLGSVAPLFSMEQCTSGNISHCKFANKTHRMMKPHWPEPNTLYKVENMGRNRIYSKSSLSLDLAVWHPDRTSGHTKDSFGGASSKWPLGHGGHNGESAPLTGPINKFVGSFFFH